MTNLLQLDHEQVADLARQIAVTETELQDLKDKAYQARDAEQSASTRLSNLKIKFTALVAGHLDDSSLISKGIPRRGVQV